MRRVTVSVTALLDGTPRDGNPRDGESAGRSDRAPRQDGDQVGTVSCRGMQIGIQSVGGDFNAFTGGCRPALGQRGLQLGYPKRTGPGAGHGDPYTRWPATDKDPHQ